MESVRFAPFSPLQSAVFHLHMALRIPTRVGDIMSDSTPYGYMIRPWREGRSFLFLHSGRNSFVLELYQNLPFPPMSCDLNGCFFSNGRHGDVLMKLFPEGECLYGCKLVGRMTGSLHLKRQGLGWSLNGSIWLSNKKYSVSGGDLTHVLNDTPLYNEAFNKEKEWIPDSWLFCPNEQELLGLFGGCLCFSFLTQTSPSNFTITCYDSLYHGIHINASHGVCSSSRERIFYGETPQPHDSTLVMLEFGRSYVREFREGERIGGLYVEDFGAIPWKKPPDIRDMKNRKITVGYTDGTHFCEAIDWMRTVENEEMIAECMSSYHLVTQCVSEQSFPEWFLREAYHITEKWKSGRFRWYESRIPNLLIEVDRSTERVESSWKIVGTNGGEFWVQPIPVNPFENGREEYTKVWKRGASEETSTLLRYSETFEEFRSHVEGNVSTLLSLVPRIDAVCYGSGELAWNLSPSAISSDSREYDLVGVLLALNWRLLRLLPFLFIFPSKDVPSSTSRNEGTEQMNSPPSKTHGNQDELPLFSDSPIHLVATENSDLSGNNTPWRHYSFPGVSPSKSVSMFQPFLLSSTRFLLASFHLQECRIPVEPPIDTQRVPDSIPLLQINRISARPDRLRQLDATTRMQASVTGQFLRWIELQDSETLRQSYVHHSHGGQRRSFVVSFIGEGGIDNGGLYRELFATTMQELHNVEWYHILRHVPNFECCEITAGKEDFMFDETADLAFIHAVGRVIGVALISGIQLNFLLSPVLWNLVCDQPIGLTELDCIDTGLARLCRQVLSGEIEHMWNIPSFNGTLLVHPRLFDTKVEPWERESFCEWAIKAVLSEQKKCCETLRDGIMDVFDGPICGMVKAEELMEMVVGVGDVNVEELRRMTKYEGFEETDKEIEWFWRILTQMTVVQRVAFLQFSTARSRLPVFSYQAPLSVGTGGDHDV